MMMWVSVLTTVSNQIALRRHCRFSNSIPICLMACEIVFARNCANNGKLLQYAWNPTISYYRLRDCIRQTYFCAIFWRKPNIRKPYFFYGAGGKKKVILLLEPCIISIGKATKHTWASLSRPCVYTRRVCASVIICARQCENGPGLCARLCRLSGQCLRWWIESSEKYLFEFESHGRRKLATLSVAESFTPTIHHPEIKG